MSPWVEIAVIGCPKTAGSKSAYPIRRKDGSYVKDPRTGRIMVRVANSDKGAQAWTRACQQAAKLVWGDAPPWNGPLEVQFIFLRRRPESHFSKRKGHEHELTASAEKAWATTPDTTKMIRCAEDALTGICWTNDSRIHVQLGIKTWSNYDGMLIRMRQSDAEYGFDDEFTRVLSLMEQLQQQQNQQAAEYF